MARPVRVLSLATEWASGHGGLSTYNRLLCGALARAGAEVFCRLPAVAAGERPDAEAAGVTLVEALVARGGTPYGSLGRRAGLPAGRPPDVILGHGLITGQYAQILQADVLPGSARYHFPHTLPDEAEWQRPSRRTEASALAQDRTEREWELAATATRVVAIGPRLEEQALSQLSGYPDAPPPLRLDPGFDVPDYSPRRPPAGRVSRILVAGRLDDDVKGVDIAARALRRALDFGGWDPGDVELVVRGVTHAAAADLRERIIQLSGYPDLRVVPRSYTTDQDSLTRDQRRAALVLMPSRAEAFGFAGLEAIVAGTPVLVSGRSGLGGLLRELLGDEAGRLVVPVRFDDEKDAAAWGHAIAASLFDRADSFATADRIRRALAARRTWSGAAARLLDSIAIR